MNVGIVASKKSKDITELYKKIKQDFSISIPFTHANDIYQKQRKEIKKADMVFMPVSYSSKTGKIHSIIGLDADAEFSRSTLASMVGKDGTVQPAPHNLFTYSNNFDNSVWIKELTTVALSDLLSPDKTTAPYLITGTDPNSRIVYDSSLSLSYAEVNKEYTASFFVFSTVSNNISITIFEEGALSYTSVIPVLSNSWQRISATAKFSDGTLGAIGVSLTVGVGSFHIWEAQLNEGNRMLDIISTTSTQVFGPRFSYNYYTKKYDGLLLEKASSNLLTYSNDFSNPNWQRSSGVTVINNATVSPSGNNDATSIEWVGFNNWTGLYQVVNETINNTVQYTASIWLRSDVEGTIILCFPYSENASTQVNVTTKWQRFSINNVVGDGAVGGMFIRQGDATLTKVYIWEAQLEIGHLATSNIRTYSVKLTRESDSCKILSSSSWFGGLIGSMYINARHEKTKSGGVIYIMAYTSTTPLYDLAQQPEYYFGTYDGVTDIQQLPMVIPDKEYKYVIGWNEDFKKIAANGALSTDTPFSGNWSQIPYIYIGAVDFFGVVKVISYWKEYLSDNDKISLTQINQTLT